MTAPRFADCRCGHAKLSHDALAPQCAALGCTCLNYRPAVAQPAAVPTTPSALRAVPTEPPATPMPPTLDQLLAAGKRSETAHIVKLAEKIANLVDVLQIRVTEEREQADAKRKAIEQREAAKREVARLEQQLAIAKAKLRGRTPPATKTSDAVSTGTGVCPDCGKDGLNNIGAHRMRAHGYRAGA